MYKVRFHDWTFSNNILHLNGHYFNGIIQLLDSGIWRIYVWHRLEDEKKSSWIVEPSPMQNFEVIQESDTLTLVNTDQPPLAIRLDDFKWTWDCIEAVDLISHSHSAPSHNESEEESFGPDDPVLELTDGSPFGSKTGYPIPISIAPLHLHACRRSYKNRYWHDASPLF